MAATVWPFTIGNVPLTRFEVPEEFETGHEIEQVVHKYLSETGTPIVAVHNLGAFPLPTTWRGILFGNTATQRMQVLDNLAVVQLPVTWVWGPLSWQVSIKSFKAIPKYNNEIHYEISLTVIKDLNGTVSTLDTGVSFDVGTQSFFDTANTAATNLSTLAPTLPDHVVVGPGGFDTTQLLNTVLLAVDAVNVAFLAAIPLKTASYTTLSNLVALIETAAASLDAYITPMQSVAVLEADLEALNQALIALQGYGLLAINIKQLIGTAQGSVQSIQFQGSLFLVAAKYYPQSDPATIAGLIATANGLTDYYLDTQTTIVLPPVFS